MAREDFDTLLNALSQRDQRAQAVQAGAGGFTAAFQGAQQDELERRKQALAEKVAALQERKQQSTEDLAGRKLDVIQQQADRNLQNQLIMSREKNRTAKDIAGMRIQAAGEQKKTKQNELQAKTTFFAGQAGTADSIISLLEKSQTGKLSQLPFIPDRFKTQDRKRFEGAANRFAVSVLRPETGAQSNESEIENTIRRFIPQPGDGPQALEEKRAARKTAINLLNAIAQGDADAARQLDQLVAVPTTLARSGQPPAAPQAAPAQQEVQAPQTDVQAMSNEDIMRMLLQ